MGGSGKLAASVEERLKHVDDTKQLGCTDLGELRARRRVGRTTSWRQLLLESAAAAAACERREVHAHYGHSAREDLEPLTRIALAQNGRAVGVDALEARVRERAQPGVRALPEQRQLAEQILASTQHLQQWQLQPLRKGSRRQLEDLDVGARDGGECEWLQPRERCLREALAWPERRRLLGLLARRRLGEKHAVAGDDEQRRAQHVHAVEQKLTGGHVARPETQAQGQVRVRPRSGAHLKAHLAEGPQRQRELHESASLRQRP